MDKPRIKRANTGYIMNQEEYFIDTRKIQIASINQFAEYIGFTPEGPAGSYVGWHHGSKRVVFVSFQDMQKIHNELCAIFDEYNTKPIPMPVGFKYHTKEGYIDFSSAESVKLVERSYLHWSRKEGKLIADKKQVKFL